MNNPDNIIRLETEKILFNFKQNLNFYEILFLIFINEKEPKFFRLQSIILIMNFIKIEISSLKNKNRGNINTNLNNILSGKNKFY
jgi:hypothetical protein